jgi:hypothetical protein
MSGRFKFGRHPESLTEKAADEIGFTVKFVMAGTSPAMTKKRTISTRLGRA